MKKVLIALLIIFILAGVGVGGFFAFKFFTENSDGGSGDDASSQMYSYQMSTDARFEDSIMELKKQLKKKDYQNMILSLDESVDAAMTMLPTDYVDAVWAQVMMPSADTVIATDLNLIFGDDAPMELTIAYVDVDAFTISDEFFEFANQLAGLGGEDETEPETQPETQPEVVNFNPTDDFRMSYQEGLKFEDKQFVDLETGFNAYKIALNNDSNASVVEEYIQSIIVNAAGDAPYTFAYYDEEAQKFSLLFDLDGRYLLIFEVDTQGNMTDYSSVYNDFINNYVPNWYKVFPETGFDDDFSGLIEETEEGDMPIPESTGGNTDF